MLSSGSKQSGGQIRFDDRGKGLKLTQLTYEAFGNLALKTAIEIRPKTTLETVLKIAIATTLKITLKTLREAQKNTRNVVPISFYGLGMGLGLGFALGLECSLAQPTIAAERLYIRYGAIERSISIDSLRQYAETRIADRELQAYLKFLPDAVVEELPEVLTHQIAVSAIEAAQFLYSPQGEFLLQRASTAITTGAGTQQSLALRGAIIRAASEFPDGITPINLLQAYPTPNLHISLGEALDLVKSVRETIAQSQTEFQQIQAISRQITPIDPTRWQAWREPGLYSWQLRPISTFDPDRHLPFGHRLEADLYLPERSSPAPLVVISHGIGSDRMTFAYLAEHLASHGFAVLVPEHAGSNAKHLQALLRGSENEIAKPSEFDDRPLDIRFWLDYLEKKVASSEVWAQAIDPDAVIVIGHSFGAYTALALAGATVNLPGLTQTCSQLETRWSWNLSLLLQCRLPSEIQSETQSETQSTTQQEMPQEIQSDSASILRSTLPRRPLPGWGLRWGTDQVSGRISPDEPSPERSIERYSGTANWFDRRVRGIVLISPIGSAIFEPSGFAQVQVPVLMVAGSADTIAPAIMEAIPTYQWLTTPDRQLVLWEGGTHFSPIAVPPGAAPSVSLPPELVGPDPQLAHQQLQAMTLAFAQQVLLQTPDTQALLTASGLNALSQPSLPIYTIDPSLAPQLYDPPISNPLSDYFSYPVPEPNTPIVSPDDLLNLGNPASNDSSTWRSSEPSPEVDESGVFPQAR